MDKKETLDLINQLIDNQKKDSLVKTIEEIKAFALAMKGQREELKKSVDNLDKIDPNSRLPGTMVNKMDSGMDVTATSPKLNAHPKQAAIINHMKKNLKMAENGQMMANEANKPQKPMMPKLKKDGTNEMCVKGDTGMKMKNPPAMSKLISHMKNKSIVKSEKPKEMSNAAKEYIKDISDKPQEAQTQRPGQANKPKGE